MHRPFAPLLLLALSAVPASAPAQSVLQLSRPQPVSWRVPSDLFTSTGQAAPAQPSEHATLAPAATGAMVMGSGGSRSQGVTLMIVGGAGILTGLLVDESAITIVGAAVAGVGLYLYLK